MPDYRYELALSHNNLGKLLARSGEATGGGGAVPPGAGHLGEAGRRLPRRARLSARPGPQPQQPGDSAGRSGETSGGGGAVPPGAGHRGEAGRRLPRRASPTGSNWPQPQQPGDSAGRSGETTGGGGAVPPGAGHLWRSWPPTSPPCPTIGRTWPSATTTWGICWPVWGNDRRRRSSTARRWPSRGSWPPTSPPCPTIGRNWPQPQQPGRTAGRSGETAGGGEAGPSSAVHPGEAGRRLTRCARLSAGTGQQPQQPGASAGRSGEASGGGGAVPPGAGHPGEAGRRLPHRARPSAGIGPQPQQPGESAGRSGETPEAEKQYRKALAIQERLAADFPAVPNYQIDLGGSYCNYGILVRNGGRANESLGWFDKAIATLAPVHRAMPGDVNAKDFWAKATGAGPRPTIGS